jgi:hypothetical protein
MKYFIYDDNDGQLIKLLHVRTTDAGQRQYKAVCGLNAFSKYWYKHLENKEYVGVWSERYITPYKTHPKHSFICYNPCNEPGKMIR